MTKEKGPGQVALTSVFVFLGLVTFFSDSPADALVLRTRINPLPAVPMDGQDLVRLLRRQHIAINFIRASTDPVVRPARRAGTLRDILTVLVSETHVYRYLIISGHLVLYPATEGYEQVVTIPRDVYQKVPRMTAATAYVEWLRTHLPEFGDLVPPALIGDPRARAYTDSVSLKPSGRILDHLVGLLGDDSTLLFAIETARSGKPMFVFYRLPPGEHR